MGGRFERYTPEEEQTLRDMAPAHTFDELAQIVEERHGTKRSKCAIQGKLFKMGVKAKRAPNPSYFKKGQEPANKGKRQCEFMSPEAIERTKATRFKKGNMPHNKVPMGSERVNVDGYVEVKVRRHKEPGKPNTFDLKHRVVWEQANGREVPEGHVVMFADGDKRNFDPDNLVCVDRRYLAKLSRGVHEYADRETLENAVALCELNSKLYERLGDISERMGGCRQMVCSRIALGWDIEKALTVPKKRI